MGQRKAVFTVQCFIGLEDESLLSVIKPATGKQLAAIPYVNRALLNKAISDARNAFAGWGAVPFGRRKATLASLRNKIDEHADELSGLFTAEQGGPLAQARWEIDLLNKTFRPVLMQMELYEKEQELQHIGTSRSVMFRLMAVLAAHGICQLYFHSGRYSPALLAGETVVLRASPFTPLTVVRISEHIRELLPPGVFNVAIGGHDFWFWMTSYSGIDVITFTKSANIGTAAEPRGFTKRPLDWKPCCLRERSTPLPGVAPMTATGRPPNAFWMSSAGLDTESNAFFRTPGIELLYSGVTIKRPSVATILVFNSCTIAVVQRKCRVSRRFQQ